jgi:hypothetical protein
MFSNLFNFKHSNGSNWWGKAKLAFIISAVLNTLICIYRIIQKQAGLGVVSWLFGTAVIYIQTLTASCLKTSKCSILAWIQLLCVILYIILVSMITFYGIKNLVGSESFEVEEEEL